MPDLSNAHSDGVSSFVSVQLSRAPAPSSATVTTLKLIGWNYEPPLVQEIGRKSRRCTRGSAGETCLGWTTTSRSPTSKLG